MADDHGHGHGDIIIIKKKASGGHGHHGGAWKIAFADFMTAMMAFFLVLWIINASDKDTKTVIARYFNPVKLENPAKARKGVHGTTSAPTEGKDEKASATSGPPSKEQDPKGAPSPSDTKAQDKKAPSKDKEASAEAKMAQGEAQLFSAPYEALDRIAGGPAGSAPGASADKGDADPQRLAGALSIDSFRDPFKPIGPGSPDDPVAFDADVRNQTPNDIEPGKTGESDKPQLRPSPKAKPETGKGAEATTAGDGPKPGDGAKPGETGKGASDNGAEAAKIEKELKEKVEAVVKPGDGPTIEAHQTKEGLLISLTDKLDFSMFDIGGATPRRELVRAMEAVAKVVRDKPGRIVVRGYTDARPYRNGAYDNWRLSTDRAQMAYYMLTRGGAPASRFSRVEGYADHALRDPAHPLSAVNRRLEILLEDPKP
jgi:chemotaxis protein MotB